MSPTDWETVLADAKDLGAARVQFIGGEPTLHPAFSDLVRFAADTGLEVEVFSNFQRITPPFWNLFAECSVRLATSLYFCEPEIHDQVTGRRGSQQRTVANIKKALAYSLPL
jgi:MoaA/NifB/PqqE/SkfB family radical SAM enzyme